MHFVGPGPRGVVDVAVLEVRYDATGNILAVAGRQAEEAPGSAQTVVLGEDGPMHLVGGGRRGPVYVTVLEVDDPAARCALLHARALAEDAVGGTQVVPLLADGG